ncbi:Protein tyrosine phosphatase [Entamoeba marina]
MSDPQIDQSLPSGNFTFDWVEQNTPQPSVNEFKTATREENLNKNRYTNVLANESTRVILSNDKYINANYVCNGRYICCQAPLTTTQEDFYNMIIETKSSIVVMLTRFEENGKIKANPYYPKEKEVKKIGNYSIKTGNLLYKEQQTINRMNMRICELIIENKTSKIKRSVVHIHFMGWPDFGVPQNVKAITDMLFISLLCRKNKISKLEGPPIIHCSAGLGRSGTFAALLRVFEEQSTTDKSKMFDKTFFETKTQPKLDLFVAQFVLSLRSERYGMVQTEEQFNFIIDVLKNAYETIFPHLQNTKTTELLKVLKPFMSETLQSTIASFMKSI